MAGKLLTGLLGAATIAAVGFLGMCYTVIYPRPRHTGKGSHEIAFAGDSITFGHGVIRHRDKAFASLVPQLLGSGYCSVNYGLSARTLLSSGDMPYFKEKNAGKFLNSQPEIVVFMLGTNDSKQSNWNAGQFRAEYCDALRKIAAMSSVKEIYCMLPPAIFLSNPGPKDCNDRILTEETIPAIQSAVKLCMDELKGSVKIHLIDLYTVTKNHSEWFDDGLHPNIAGNKVIADVITEAMTVPAKK